MEDFEFSDQTNQLEPMNGSEATVCSSPTSQETFSLKMLLEQKL